MQNGDLESIRDNLQIDEVAAKAAQFHGWSGDDTEYAKEWYTKHLLLCKKYPDTQIAALSKKADELWHQHIIDTQKYEQDCNSMFGRIIHHRPIYGEPTDDEKRVHDETVELYSREFGAIPPDISMLSFIPW